MTGAIARFDAALKLRPDFYLARLARATSRTVLGARESALEDLNQLMATPVAADALLLRGLMRLEGSDFAEAAKDLHRAVELAPNHAVAWNALGILHARQNKWAESARAFETAFKYSPDLVEAKANYQLALGAGELGTSVSTSSHLGVFGTGINSEGDIKYAKSHANHLMPPGEKEYLYVAIKGNLPLGGVEKMKQQGVATLVVDPRNMPVSQREIDRFIKNSIDNGNSPVIFVDVNKRVPTQLGNDKPETLEVPAKLVAQASVTFKNEIIQRGIPGGTSVAAAHSEGTRFMLEGVGQASKQGAPFNRAVVESVRSEQQIATAVRDAPSTKFTAVQPIRGDLWTQEAQGRSLTGQRGAYSKTIEGLKSIKAPNYEFALIENPSQTRPSFPHPGGAHGDSASYDRLSKVTVWQNGKQVQSHYGPLGPILGATDLIRPQTPNSPSTSMKPGGISLGPVSVITGEGGKVVFKAGGGGKLKIVYTLYRNSAAEPGNVPSPPITQMITTNN